MFEFHYGEWLEDQISSGSSERQRRLREHGYAERIFMEQVWLPAIGQTVHLHGEYEVSDFKDGVRFLDFAYAIRTR